MAGAAPVDAGLGEEGIKLISMQVGKRPQHTPNTKVTREMTNVDTQIPRSRTGNHREEKPILQSWQRGEVAQWLALQESLLPPYLRENMNRSILK